jgi:DNA-binding MarR family transcriptional regulator
MSLKEELSLYKSIETIEHECLLNIIYTGTLLSKISYKHFSKFNLTESQFNVLMQLKYSEKEGVSQVVLSKRLFVNKSDITGLIDRLEKVKLVERLPHKTDRRVNIIKITKLGFAKVEETEKEYFKIVNKIMKGLANKNKKLIVKCMETIRDNVRLNIENMEE